MNVLPIGGKSDSSTLVGVSVDNSGNVKTKKTWATSIEKIVDVQTTPTSTNTIVGTLVDLSDDGSFSLRINNMLDVEIQIGFYADWYNHDYQMRDVNGSLIRFNIPANTRNVIVTQDDVPIMQWLTSCKVYVIPREIPTSGTLEIWAVTKA